MKTATKSIKPDYLNGDPALQPFYKYAIQQTDFGQLIQDKASDSINRAVLKQVVQHQYEGFSVSEKTKKNIEALGADNTFTITTGHQLVLFGGPLYTSYKILSAIELAAHLQAQFQDKHFVPVFWIHTEDHDFEEINHYYDSFFQKRTYQGQFQSSVGTHVLEPSIKDLIPQHFPSELKNTYEASQPMAMAYRRFMFELFDSYGLIILDASHPELKAQFQRVINAELQQSASFVEVSRTSEQLAGAGYPLQITPREINLFYLDEAGRNRIISQNGHFKLADRSQSFEADEMFALTSQHPEYFSPNVSLRPLYQEMILPNLAYFGGWGEVAYWLQLKGVFDYFGVNFPLVLPRMSATVFTQSQWKDWKEMGFEPADIGLNTHTLYQKFLPNVWNQAMFNQLESRIMEELDVFRVYIEDEISTTLARSAEALKVKTAKYLKTMRKKAGKVMRHKHSTPFKKIDQLKLSIQPDGLVQERVLSLASFPELSPSEFIEFVRPFCKPMDFSHNYIQLSI